MQSIFLVLTIFKTQFFGNRFPSIFLPVFAVKVLVAFVKDSIFLNCDRNFLFAGCHFVFDLFIWEAIEQNIQSNSIRTWLRNNFFFFPLLPLREFPCEQKVLLERKFYAKAYERHKVREWMNIWLNAGPYVEKYANVNAALDFV